MPALNTRAQEKLQDIAPYALGHGEILSPEQKDIIAPALELCDRVLEEGQSAILLGSRALAPCLLPYLTDPIQHKAYLAEIGNRDFDVHLSETATYYKFANKLDVQTRGYAYGVRGTTNKDLFDIVDNERLATAYKDGARAMLQIAEAKGVDTVQAKKWLDFIEQGYCEYIIPLTRVYTSSAVGLRLVKRDGKTEARVFDPLGFLENVETRDLNLEATTPINPNSVRFLLIESLRDTHFSDNPYSTGERQIPSILTDPALKEIAHSSLGELPSLAKTILTHDLGTSNPYLKDIYNATRVLAQINPYYAIENPIIANYVKNVQAILATNLHHFEASMSFMLQELPLGWCICPESSSTVDQIARRPVVIGTDTNPTARRVLPIIQRVVRENGNPTTLEEALGMYLAAEFGRANPENTPDYVEREQIVDRLFEWWRNNYPNLDKVKVLTYYNSFDGLPASGHETVDSIRA